MCGLEQLTCCRDQGGRDGPGVQAVDRELAVLGDLHAPVRVQGATYRVAQVLKGTVAGSELRVAHKVCLGQPLIDNRTVGLATAWFEPGRRVVLFVERDAAGTVREARADGEWVSEYAVFDERCGVLPDSELLREQIAKAAAAGGKGTGGDPFR